MMEAYSQDVASPIFFIVYLIITLYFITNIVGIELTIEIMFIIFILCYCMNHQ